MNPEEMEPQSPDLDNLHRAVREAFNPVTSAEQAAVGILAKLPAGPPAQRVLLPRLRWDLAAGILLLVGLLGGFTLGRHDRGSSPNAPMIDVRVSALSGTALVKHAGQDTWHELAPAATLRLGDVLHAAGNSAVTLSLWDRSSIRLDANTTLSADAFNGRVEFALSSGTINADLQSAHPRFFIRTPQGILEALGTAFVVSVD
jgi:hypothetical protein